MPSVAHLIRTHRLSPDTVQSIPRTGLSLSIKLRVLNSLSGPKNRLLKGDVLAYLANPDAAISAASASDVRFIYSQRFLSHWQSISTSYFERFVPVDALYTISKAKNVKFNDAVIKAIAATLTSLPERKCLPFTLLIAHQVLVTGSQDQVSVTRVTGFGTFGSTINKVSTVKAAKISDSFKKINSVSEIPSSSFTYGSFHALCSLS